MGTRLGGLILFDFAAGFPLGVFLDVVLCLTLLDLVDTVDAFACRGLLFSFAFMGLGARPADDVIAWGS